MKKLLWVALGVVAATVVLLGRILWDVCSAAGVAYALGLGDGTSLFFPAGTAVMFWLLVVLAPTELAVLSTMRLDWREARLEPNHTRQAWLAAHISLHHRVSRRVQWWNDGRKIAAKQRARAAQFKRTPALAAAVHVAPSTTPTTAVHAQDGQAA